MFHYKFQAKQQHEFLGARSGRAEDSDILGHDATSLGNRLSSL
jgi:hypothetical protein